MTQETSMPDNDGATVTHLPENMSSLERGPRDVFVSYSRQDKTFVDIFCTSLKQADLSYWIDKHEIPPTVDWWNDIKSGIKQANVFVFIASANSFTSPYCNLELEFARENTKKIVFIACEAGDWDKEETRTALAAKLLERADRSVTLKEIRAVDDLSKILKTNLGVFSQHQAVSLFPETEYDFQFPNALEAIKKDYAYVAEHTRWLLRAHDWEQSGRKGGYLLRSENLASAEKWITNSTDLDPVPTTLHREYITESRKATDRRNRITIGSLSVGLLIALILATIAFIAERRAVTSEAEAIEQRNEAQRVAQTFAMVDTTLKQPVGQRPSAPVRLGLDIWISSRDDNTVWQLAADTGQPRGEPITVGARPLIPVTDGVFVWVSSSEGTTLTRIDPRDVGNLMHIEVGKMPGMPVIAGDWIWISAGDVFDRFLVQIERHSGEIVGQVKVGRNVGDLLFDGTYVWAVVDDVRRPHLLQVHHVTGESHPVETERNPTLPVLANGSAWITLGESGVLQQLDPESRTIINTYQLGGQLITQLYDGEYIWIRDTGAGETVQFNPVTGRVLRRLPVSASQLPFRHGNQLWLRPEGKLTAYNVESGQQEISSPLIGNYSELVVAGDTLWLSSSSNNVLIVFRLSDGAHLRTLPHCEAPSSPLFDGVNIWVSCVNENAVARIPALMSYYGLNPFLTDTEPETPIYTRSADQEFLWIVQAATGDLVQFDATNGLILATIPVGRTPSAPVYDGNRYIWIASGQSGVVTRIDTLNTAQVRTLPIDKADVGNIQLEAGAVWVTTYASDISTFTGNDLYMIDPRMPRIRKAYDLGLGTSSVVFDAERDVIWVSGSSINAGTAYRLNATNGEILGETTVGLVSYEPVLHGNDVWISSLYPADATDLFEAVLSSNTGSLYRLSRDTGELITTYDLDELPSKPIFAGNHLWITQGSFEIETVEAASLLGGEQQSPNPRGIVAINPETGEFVKTWSPCRNLGIPFYDGRYVWGICIGYEDSQSDDSGTIVVIDPERLEMVHEYQGLGRFPWPAMQLHDSRGQLIDENIWVVYQSSGNIAIFDSETAELLRVIGVGTSPSKPVYDNSGFLWIANGGDGTVQRIQMPLDRE